MTACAYCWAPVQWKRGAIELRGEDGKADREGKIATLKCPHCDSTFEIHITTKRKSKGKRLRAVEAKREIERRAAVDAAIAHNAKLAAELLAQPGCTCAAAQAEDSPRWRMHGYGDYVDRERRRIQLAEYGHLFSSKGSSRGIPCEPRHDYECPLFRKGTA